MSIPRGHLSQNLHGPTHRDRVSGASRGKSQLNPAKLLFLHLLRPVNRSHCVVRCGSMSELVVKLFFSFSLFLFLHFPSKFFSLVKFIATTKRRCLPPQWQTRLISFSNEHFITLPLPIHPSIHLSIIQDVRARDSTSQQIWTSSIHSSTTNYLGRHARPSSGEPGSLVFTSCHSLSVSIAINNLSERHALVV